MKSKKAVYLFLICLFSLFGTTVTFNIIVDPTDIFESDIFRPLIRTSRFTKINLLKSGLNQNPDFLIMGSSRAMKLNPDLLDSLLGVTSFNASINSAKIEDHYAMLQYCISELDLDIKNILLSLDLETISNQRIVESRLFSTPDLLKYIRKDIPYVRSYFARFEELITLKRTRLSLRSVKYFITDYPEKSSFFGENGILIQPKLERQIREGKFNLQKKLNDREHKDTFHNYHEFAEWRIDLLRKFLTLARARNIKVIAFLSPYHPWLSDILSSIPNYNSTYKKFLSEMKNLEKEGLLIFSDYHHISMFNGLDSDFYNAGHMTQPNADRLLKHLFSQSQFNAF